MFFRFLRLVLNDQNRTEVYLTQSIHSWWWYEGSVLWLCTLFTRHGIFILFVANPIGTVMAASVPRNSATSSSSSACMSKNPESNNS